MTERDPISVPATKHIDTTHPSFAGIAPSALRRFRQHLAGDLSPVTARRASTVVLVRRRPTGPEVLLLRRSTSMSFAPGMYVFPGGVVDPGDSEPSAAWTGPSPTAWAEQLGTSVDGARTLVTAAVRETFEESGVLLAGVSAHHVAVPDPSWRRHRASIEDRSTSFTDFLGHRGLAIRSDLLRPWSRWVTPLWSPRRYDTVVLVARLPDGQRVDSVNAEFDRHAWSEPSAALREYRAGALPMMLPTASTLAELAAVADIDDYAYDGTERMVRALTDDGLRLVIDSRDGPIDKHRYLERLLR